MHRKVRLIQPVHAQHAQPVLAAGRIGAQTHQGRGNRKARGLCQLTQQAAGFGACVDHAAAGVKDRAFGLFHQFDQREDRIGIALGARLIMRNLGLLRADIGAGRELHILGNVDQHRARTALRCDVEGLMDGLGQLVRLFHQPVMLGAGAGDANGVGLLECVVADQEGRNLPGQNHQRDRVQKRVSDAGHRVGRAGARGDKNHAGLAGRAGVALSRVNRALFMPHKNVANVVLLKDLVIDR
ncbi:hypothetical protein GALL_473370 [mine drainage metagenome]|uniref:Uncharacterized protein n=1 Tax=mine drainage metagenome TaxID=410659 RepID=A0A1J5PHG8_9ZZZZ